MYTICICIYICIYILLQGALAPLPPYWCELTDSGGDAYFYNITDV